MADGVLFCSLLEGQTTVTEPFRARSKTSCAGDAGGGTSKVPDARRAVSMRLQALRAAAAPHRFIAHYFHPFSGQRESHTCAPIE